MKTMKVLFGNAKEGLSIAMLNNTWRRRKDSSKHNYLCMAVWLRKWLCLYRTFIWHRSR